MGWSRDPPQPVGRGQAVPEPMEGTGGADADLQPGEDPTAEQGLCLEEAGMLRAAPAVVVQHGQDCDTWEGPTLEQFGKSCTPWEGLMSEKVPGGLFPVRGAPRWHRGRVQSPAPEEKGAAETRGDEPTTTPILYPPEPLEGKR